MIPDTEANRKKIEHRLISIHALYAVFCQEHLNEEYANFCRNLMLEIFDEQAMDILRGNKVIWAASITHVIARVNFLYDPEHKLTLTLDKLCDFFGVKKRTIGDKASQILKLHDIYYDNEDYCDQSVVDAMSFVETPEGFIIPMNMLQDIAEGNSDEGKQFVAVETNSGLTKEFLEKQRLEKNQEMLKKKYPTVKEELDNENEKKEHLEKFGDQLSF